MEDPFIRAYDHAAYESPDLEGQGVRHCNVPDSFFRLWGLDEFSAIDDLEVRTDRNDIPIYGRRHEGQELAFPKAAVEQDVESYFIVQGDHLLPELLILVMRPDVHFIGLGPSDQAGNSTRIDLKPIIFYCIVENRGQLCVNGPKICLRVGIPVRIRNCPNLTGSINLSACENLVSLFAEGTAITSVLFAANGKIVHAHLPATINSLTFRQIQYLTDLILASYGNLESFICEYSNLDALTIIQTAISTLQICRVLGIDWELATTDTLNAILGMSQSLLTGEVYISGQIRNQELLNYDSAWPDLDVTYDPQNLVTQYPVTFVNADGTTLYETYVDRGSSPVDPVTAGLIDTPTKAPDAQYVHTYTGWDDIESPVLAAKTITAQYSESIRSYTVRWLSRVGLVLETQTCEYGSEAVFSGDIPTNREEESSYIYNLFAGWDKSTGFITGDTDVYAIWERAELPVMQ